MASESETATPKSQPKPWPTVVCVTALLAVFFLLADTAVRSKSATVDEPLHAVAAWLESRYGDYLVNAEDPPLFKYWAMLTMPHDALAVNRDLYEQPVTQEWSTLRWGWAIRVLYRGYSDGDAFLGRARTMMLMLGTAVGAVIAWWSYRLAGSVAAIVAAMLFCFDPNFLGHAPLVKNDVAITLVMVSLAFALWFLGRRATWRNFLAVALLAGAGMVTKFSGILLAPIVVLLLLIRALLPQEWNVLGNLLTQRRPKFIAAALICLGVAIVSFGMIWMVYGFRFSPTPEGLAFDQSSVVESVRFKATYAKLRREPTPQEVLASPVPLLARAVVFADEHRLLPQAWLTGLLYTYQSSLLRTSYLLGEQGVFGWWYYFPLAMLFKTPLATLTVLLIAAGVAVFAISRQSKNSLLSHAWTIACLAIPVLIYGYTAITSNLNLGLRHMLPVYPFLFISIAVAFAALWRRRIGRIVVVLLVIGVAVESVGAFPHYIAFFNKAAGGSRGGFRLLSDSNLDWGQDLKLLAEWQQNNPTEQLYLAYFGAADPEYYGIQYINLPDGYMFGPQPQAPTAPGVLAISATILQGKYSAENRAFFETVRAHQPFEVLGGSIYLFNWPLE